MFCSFLYSSLYSNDILNIINSNLSTGALGVVSIVIMSILGCIGMDIEAEVQYALLITIIVGIFNLIIGSYIRPKSDLEMAPDFTGYNMKNYLDYENFKYFLMIFTRFFPTVTSINAGVKYSPEDLKVMLYQYSIIIIILI
ncbi:PREDICTED: solute carrier family 12 member 2-like [Diuraphis noxia]|uniref:solute carrier family 12 member 2-like n=1 Tax=Diuraphis noxia TaxID=143948 RepID=UPI0007639DD4|nr:PREDICTED: solute carrier family 12 member 2-like [Diuraphis noxia]